MRTKAKKGMAFIYVLIIMIPVIFASLSLIDMTSTDYFIGDISNRGYQTLYNTELGLDYGLKILQKGNYTGVYNLDNSYIIFDNAKNISESKNYSRIILYNYLNKKEYKITSLGYYMGISNKIETYINKNHLMNLRRKLIANSLYVSGRLDFYISSNNLGNSLLTQDSILLLGKGVVPYDKIHLFSNGEEIIPSIPGGGLFCEAKDKNNRIYNISSKDNSRGFWNVGEKGIRYYILGNESPFLIDINNIQNSTDAFYNGFLEYSGSYNDGTGLNQEFVRVVLTPGDVFIKGFRGDFTKGITKAERYLNNLVIYSTGRVTIEDSSIFKGGGTDDIEFSIIANEIDFKTSDNPASYGNVISYMSGNKGLIKNLEGEIIKLIEDNTYEFSNWATGY